MSTAETQQPVTGTTSGMVMGKEKNGVLMFCGIPYAAPPTGERRFHPPEAPDAWDDIRDATRFGPAAPQLPSGGMTNNQPVPWDEDCLFLNVTTPAVDDARRPVLVWIHGGAYRSGQGNIPWYNGTSFALNGDIVVVTINYRLGALGFADLSRFGDDFANSGINGILDQIAALRWVQDNIARFGGDPNRVTIAGESAGGFAVTTLLGSEMAQPLFHRAIPQSGAAHHTLSKEEAGVATDLLLQEMGVDTMDALMAASPLEILEAQTRVDIRWAKEGHDRGTMAFYPVDGNEVLPDGLRAAIDRGVGADKPVLTGANKDENTLFIMKAPSRDQLKADAARFGDESILAKYEKMMPGAGELDLAVAMHTDFMFRVPCIRLAETRSRQDAETWVYQFDWESRAPHLKAAHALEIPFAFNTLGAPGVDVFIGPGEVPQSVADEMHDTWTRFIRGEALGWPAYNEDTRSVWHFDHTSQLVENGDQDMLAAWDGIR